MAINIYLQTDNRDGFRLPKLIILMFRPILDSNTRQRKNAWSRYLK